MTRLLAMRRGAIAAMVATVAACSSPPPVLDIPSDPRERIEERYIVAVAPSADPAAVAARVGATPTFVYEGNPGFHGFAALLTYDMLADLEADPDVPDIAGDRIVHAFADGVPFGVNRIGAQDNPIWYDIPIDADVAIIDTGIDTGNTDLDIAGGADFTGTGSYNDDHGHGSHVAGTVGALANGVDIVGAAPGARVWGVKVLHADGSGTDAEVIAGLNWAVASGIPIANLSLGGPGTDTPNCGMGAGDLFHQAFCDAVAAGTTVIVAAGNDKTDAAGFTPAAYDEVITVSALSDLDGLPGGLAHSGCSITRGNGDDKFANFSNYGADIAIMAPGVCVYSFWKAGGHAIANGTSQAAPHVAGAAAVYLHQHPGASPAQIRAGLLARAKSLACNATDGVCAGDPDGIQEPLVFLGYFDESFENDTPGSIPACIDTTSGDVSAVVDGSMADGSGDAGSQSVSVETLTDSVDPDYTRVLFCAPTSATHRFKASFAVNFDNLVDDNPIAILDPTASEMLYWWWVDGLGNITDDAPVGTVTAGGWHQLTIEINRDAGTSTFSVDGAGTTSDLSIWGTSATTPMGCVAFTTWPDALQLVHLDNVLVSSMDH